MSGYTPLPGNPILGNGSACFSQHVFGNTLHTYYCKDTGGIWTLDYRTADLSAGRQQTQIPDTSKWTSSGGAWSSLTVAQQFGASGIVTQGTTTAFQILRASTFTGADYVLEAYGQQLSGNEWGLGFRVADPSNYFTFNLYQNIDQLYLYNWVGGSATEVTHNLAGTINMNTWYKMTVKVHNSFMDAYIDDVLRVQATSVAHPTGGIALFGENGTNAQWNDVRVRKYAYPEPILTFGTPTAVTVSSFTGLAHLSSVQLDWETANEINLVGFNVYRSQTLDGAKHKLNAILIPALNPDTLLGASYQFFDVVDQGKRYYYWLELVKHHGTELLDPVAVDTDYLVRLPLMTR